MSSSDTRVAVSSLSTLCLVELLDKSQLNFLISRYYHLSYALAIVDSEVLAAKIDKHDTYLAPIVGVDGARSVQHCYAMLQRET